MCRLQQYQVHNCHTTVFSSRAEIQVHQPSSRFAPNAVDSEVLRMVLMRLDGPTFNVKSPTDKSNGLD